MTVAAAAVERPRIKSPEAFRTISEVSSELDVPQHVLRFWEGRFTQIKPVKRAGGRRYYRPDDVDLLRGIRTLLYHDGFTIKGVQKVLRERGVRYVIGLGRGGEGYMLRPVSVVEDAEPEAASAVVEDEPTHARAAIAVVERAHTPAAEAPPQKVTVPALTQAQRVKLEMALGEMLHLKARLRERR